MAGAFLEGLQLQTSRDLVNWEPVSVTNRITDGSPLRIPATPSESRFYRVIGKLGQAGVDPGGAEVFGFNQAFAKELARIGQISPQEFAELFPQSTEYLAGISWDPTTAQFWDAFNIDPVEYNKSVAPGQSTRTFDFRLDEEELKTFKRNGFVVSERLGSYSFASSFYRIYFNDLPVFVSTDAILHAWHRSYLAMLEELEEGYLRPTLAQIVDAMANALPQFSAAYGDGPLRESILDADYFLTVARSLLSDSRKSSALGQDDKVNLTLTSIHSLSFDAEFSIFGTNRPVDFSQFLPRGHYVHSSTLQSYFRALIWLGRIDFRISQSLRELGTAVVLQDLLRTSDQFQAWVQFDNLLRIFVGRADSMNFAQMGDLVAAANIASPLEIRELSKLEALQRNMLLGQIGVQNIRGDFFWSPLSPQQLKLPRSFAVFGQRFVLDTWALSQVVFDSIIWDDNGIPEIKDKVQRRIPSALDVAFAVLGNSQVVPELVSRMTNPGGVQFRDRLPYQHNLAAARTVIDSQSESVWTDSIYSGWLEALRQLSSPTIDAQFLESMRTRAWAMKTVNTQLASWTELRHDTLLYAKQTYTAGMGCSYPFGFVEPRKEFWRSLGNLAVRTAAWIEALPLEGGNWVADRGNLGFSSGTVYLDYGRMKTNQIAFLRHFADVMRILWQISDKELNREPLLWEESMFLKSVIEQYSLGYIGTTYSGWYPSLFYQNGLKSRPFLFNEGSDKWDALVADVHTDPPDDAVLDPGSILHQGVGYVFLMMLAVENGPDRMVYAGPVLSHYEFTTGFPIRQSDSAWRDELQKENVPPHPEWTRSYLVPGRMPRTGLLDFGLME